MNLQRGARLKSKLDGSLKLTVSSEGFSVFNL